MHFVQRRRATLISGFLFSLVLVNPGQRQRQRQHTPGDQAGQPMPYHHEGHHPPTWPRAALTIVEVKEKERIKAAIWVNPF